MKRGVIILIFLFVLGLSFVNGGFFDWFKDVRKSPSGQQNFSVSVGNVAPQITLVQAPSPFGLLEGGAINITINFTAYDKNGYNTLNDATAFALLNKTGEQTRSNTCYSIGNNPPKEKYYQCNVTMLYYDAYGVWSINVSIADNSGLRSENTSQSFSVQQLKGISLSPAIITFPTVTQGDANITSLQNTTVTNTGNFVVPAYGNFYITSQALIGDTTPSENISGSNFRAGGTSGGANLDPCNDIDATPLLENTQSNIISTTLNKNPPTNTEEIAHCLTLVPNGISEQIYSTTGGNPWTFEI